MPRAKKRDRLEAEGGECGEASKDSGRQEQSRERMNFATERVSSDNSDQETPDDVNEEGAEGKRRALPRHFTETSHDKSEARADCATTRDN